jgi:hypothetical protein
MDLLQFYPTPPALAARAWAKFQDKDFALVLEPSAGTGELARAHPYWSDFSRNHRKPQVHCIEIDVRHHVRLQEDFAVVGLDFLRYSGAAMYSHIIMNPPFAEGARHVLKAWELLWDGEIVAILNAETVRNACTKERKQLLDLIQAHGSCEFIAGAFEVQDAERKTSVDVALVHLVKTADTDEIVGDLIGGLREDHAGAHLADAFQDAQELALPASQIHNLVLTFQAALAAMRASVLARARASHYSGLLGHTLAVRRGDRGESAVDCSKESVRRALNKEYDELKDRAWAAVLHTSEVLSKLSSSGQQMVESQFSGIKKLEFTESNIRGFLLGLCENQGHIQLQMACDVFDAIARHHTDNAAFYKGWKSNDKHRTCGRRIKATRFVLPHHGTDGYCRSLPWRSEQLLADFDKVFAMLDGKSVPEYSLVSCARDHFQELRMGGRVSSSYFDLRYYPQAGTIHFFPRDRALVDRLNRIVGRERQWLPPEGARVSKGFWLQYEGAEKMDREFRAALQKRNVTRGSWWDNPLRSLDKEDNTTAHERVHQALSAVHEAHNINLGDRIEHNEPEQLLLAA